MAIVKQPSISNVEARQGEIGGHMRGVLVVSTGLAILILGCVYLWFMVVQGH